MKLFEHQKYGVKWLLSKKGAILGDVMGLGKTLQALVTANYLLKHGKAKQVCIVVPALLLINWIDEAQDKLGITLHPYHGPKRDPDLIRRKKWIITTYNMLLTDLKHFDALREETVVILDEGHQIANSANKRARYCKMLPDHKRILLTGTPVWNMPDGLWSLIDFARPDLAGSKALWLVRYCHMKDNGYGEMKAVKFKNIDGMRNLLKNVLLRRDKSELKDLPEKQTVYLRYELDKKTEDLFHIVKQQAQDNDYSIGKTLTRLSQCLDGMIKQDDVTFYNSAKLKRLVELLEGRSDKFIVWSKFKEPLPYIKKHLEKELKCKVFLVTGDINYKERDRIIKEWKQTDDGILLATISSAGIGLNLTECADAVFYSCEYVPTLNAQAEDRIHRIGQRRKSTIYYLYARQTIEEAIMELMKDKRRMQHAILSKKNERRIIKELYQRTFTLFQGDKRKYNYYMREAA